MPGRGAKPVALLDACVLVPMPLADTLLRMAEPPALFAARWSELILREVTRTLELQLGKSADQARTREAAMREYFPEALVTGYRRLIPGLRNHPKDRHVLAAALAGGADFLVTFNLRDFPPALRGGRLRVIGPSAFLKHLLALDPGAVWERLEQQAGAIGAPTPLLLRRLANAVPAFVHALEAP